MSGQPPAQSGGPKKRGSIHLSLYIKAATQLGYDSRKIRKGSPEYAKVMALKKKMFEAMDKA